jgi:hypothetical protein
MMVWGGRGGPPDFRFFSNGASWAYPSCGADIRVRFSENVSLVARQTFKAAAEVWEERVNSDVPIRVTVKITGEGLPDDEPYLGGARAAAWFSRSTVKALPRANTYYPAPLAEELTGRTLNDRDPDIIVFIGNHRQWHFGTDGNPSKKKFDFMSMAVHELGHGLGFDSSLASNKDEWHDLGREGNAYPAIYDWFLYTERAGYLASKYWSADNAHVDPELAHELTSSDLLFNGTYARAANGGTPARLYAPADFDPGSSVAHLDLDTYRDTSDSLMTPEMEKGPRGVRHSAGQVTLGVLADLGWTMC